MNLSQKDEYEMVDSRDIALHTAYHAVLRERTGDSVTVLQKEVEHRQFTDTLFATHFGEFPNAPEIPQDWKCYKRSVERFEEACGRMTGYSLQYARRLANLCDTTPEKIEETFAALEADCAK